VVDVGYTGETLRGDFIALWTAQRLPIKSILLVTHNIEEAVFMCDRILILSSNPGRIAAEIVVPLARPRNRLATAFRDVVDDTYIRMAAGQPPAVDGGQGTELCVRRQRQSLFRIMARQAPACRVSPPRLAQKFARRTGNAPSLHLYACPQRLQIY